MIILDASRMDGRRNAHEYLKKMLDFPDYYGMNLDALYDCLTELAPTQIAFENTEDAPAYFQKVFRVFRDAARHNGNITIVP